MKTGLDANFGLSFVVADRLGINSSGKVLPALGPGAASRGAEPLRDLRRAIKMGETAWPDSLTNPAVLFGCLDRKSREPASRMPNSTMLWTCPCVTNAPTLGLPKKEATDARKPSQRAQSLCDLHA